MGRLWVRALSSTVIPEGFLVMNYDYLKSPTGPHTERLQCLSSVYQFQQMILEPTLVTGKSSTLIDLAFTNELSNMAKSGVIHCGMSDYSIIFVVRKIIPRKVKREVQNLNILYLNFYS